MKTRCHSAGSRRPTVWLAMLTLGSVMLGLVAGAIRAEAEAPSPVDDEAIIAAFAAVHEGYSSDELLIRDRLRNAFCDRLGINVNAPVLCREALLRLLNIRKAGKLGVRSTRRGDPPDESILPVAELAARVVLDRHRITTDELLADPRRLAEFDREVNLIDATIGPVAARKAVLSLRKRRALRPELVLKVTDWGRTVVTLSLTDLRRRLQAGNLPDSPGIYLFRTGEGYLYIGEAKRLANRLRQHILGSDRVSLADALAAADPGEISVELHVFDNASPARKATLRRAYESELIRSRKPRFNVRP